MKTTHGFVIYLQNSR